MKLSIKPYYSDDNGELYHADCLELMKEMPDNCVDLVVTDPPYKDEDVAGDYWEFLDTAVEQMRRIAGEYLIMFNGSTRLYEIMIRYGKPHRILVWTKGKVKYAYRWEPILIYDLNPSFKINKSIFSDALPYMPLCKSQSWHRYEKPLNLMRNVVRYIPKDKIILDPFAGSGTTLVAAKQLGRRYVGVEIEEKYCEIAAQRLTQEVLRL